GQHAGRSLRRGLGAVPDASGRGRPRPGPPPLSFRYARPGDSFVALGHPNRTPDPPKPGEVVYANAEKRLGRRRNWHQDARSAMVPSTKRAVLTVQALAPESAVRLETAAVELCALLRAHCNARTARAVGLT